MRQLSIGLAANQALDLYESGSYFRVLDAPGGKITVESASPALFAELLEGQSVRVEGAFNALRLTNGATPQTVKVIIGTGEFSDNTFSGAVTVEGVAAVAGAVTVSGPVSIPNGVAPCVRSVLAGRYAITAAYVSYLAARPGRKRLTIWFDTQAGWAHFGDSSGFLIGYDHPLVIDGFEGPVFSKHNGIAAGLNFIEEF